MYYRHDKPRAGVSEKVQQTLSRTNMKKKKHILSNIIPLEHHNETKLQDLFRRFVEPRWIDNKRDIYGTDVGSYGIERYWQAFHIGAGEGVGVYMWCGSRH